MVRLIIAHNTDSYVNHATLNSHKSGNNASSENFLFKDAPLVEFAVEHISHTNYYYRCCNNAE
jgi:hypothetical protein